MCVNVCVLQMRIVLHILCAHAKCQFRDLLLVYFILSLAPNMPRRHEKSTCAATVWTFSVSGCSSKQRTELAKVRARIQLERHQNERKIVSWTAESITVAIGKPLKYDAVSNWIKRMTDDKVAINYVVTPVIAEESRVPTIETAPVGMSGSRGVTSTNQLDCTSWVETDVSNAPHNTHGVQEEGKLKQWLPASSLLCKCDSVLRSDNLHHAVYSFSASCILGDGTTADVISAFHEPTQQEVALKAFKVQDERAHVLAEAIFLREVGSHPNVVALLDVCRIASGPALVFPKGTGLLKLLRDASGTRHPLHPTEVLAIAGQLFRGLEHVHSCSVLHTDIKPENILALARPDFQLWSQCVGSEWSLAHSDEASAEPADAVDSLAKRAQWLCELEHCFVIQICDFGAARWMDPRAHRPAKDWGYWQTLWYRAPEVLCRHFDRRQQKCLISEE